MSLLTRCKNCHTVFRITPEQLQAHGGQVRCGRCMQIFNGLAALVPDAAPAVTPAVTEPVAETTGNFGAAVSTESGSWQAIDILPELPPAADDFGEAAPADVSGPAADATAPVEAALVVAAQPPSVAAMAEDNPFVEEPVAEETPQPRRPLLAAASVLLVCTLVVQAVFFYRGEIAARHPLARQWLNDACARVGCAVPLPQRPAAVIIEASDLQVLDPARPNRIQLTATLRNHAGHDVAYPALDLVLTNANDHTLARRIFLPEEYLGKGHDPRAGIAANAELTVRLALETVDSGAAGFRLAALAAPPR